MSSTPSQSAARLDSAPGSTEQPREQSNWSSLIGSAEDGSAATPYTAYLNASTALATAMDRHHAKMADAQVFLKSYDLEAASRSWSTSADRQAWSNTIWQQAAQLFEHDVQDHIADLQTARAAAAELLSASMTRSALRDLWAEYQGVTRDLCEEKTTALTRVFDMTGPDREAFFDSHLLPLCKKMTIHRSLGIDMRNRAERVRGHVRREPSEVPNPILRPVPRLSDWAYGQPDDFLSQLGCNSMDKGKAPATAQMP